MKKIKNILLVSMLIPSTTFAVSVIPYKDQTLLPIIYKVTEFILGFAGAAAVLAIVYSGLLFATAGGNAERQERAKKTLTYAIYGVIIIVLVYVIITLIANSLDALVQKADEVR